MDNEYAADLITLLDDEDNEHTFGRASGVRRRILYI